MSSTNDSNDPFGAINFGEFRKYMQNKKSKLKRQEKELQDQSSQKLPQIFSGTSIHVNGYTNPPSNELRKLILQHGGDYQHYLKKLSVTHIIATNLTNSKIEEFRAYKVVKPTWITDSIQAGKLLPWQDYRLVSTSSRQKELFVSRSNEPTGETLNAQLLANTKTREMSTANPEFLDRFYKSSRLHYLSTWKSELKEIVERLEESGVKKFNVDSKKRKRDTPRIVMHVDFDCFFASVGIKDRPHLVNKPVAVSHSTTPNENSSSDIASCNYIARSFGLRNGMAIGKAKQLCPDLQVIPYEFDKYKDISTKFYEILFQYADKMQAISVDEALLEVGSYIDINEVEGLATRIRSDIKSSTGCDASIGIGPNILLAKMSTRKAKPAGQFYCKTQSDMDSLLNSQTVMQLPGVGYAISEKLKDMNIEYVSDLRKVSLNELQSKIGTKLGKTLYDYSRGIDNQPLVTEHKRASVSAEVNWGVRFENEDNEREFVYSLSKEVSDRLRKYQVKGKSITLKLLKRKEDAVEASKHLGHGIVDSYSKSVALNEYTDDPAIINTSAYGLLKSFHVKCTDVRGIGIHISKLNNQDNVSADQGKLDFAKHAKKSEQVTEITETTEIIAANTTSPHRTKQDLVLVMYSVLSDRELPDSMQRELESEYKLIFHDTTTSDVLDNPVSANDEGSNNEHGQTSPGDLLAELPPWSQLDPSALLALPDNMREQVLRAYEEKSRLKKEPVTNTNIAPPRTPTHYRPTTSRVKKTPRRRNNNPTISDMLKNVGSPSRTMEIQTRSPSYRNSRTKPLFDSNEELPFDEEVWNNLPKSIQAELLDEHRKARSNRELEQVSRDHMSMREATNTVHLKYIEEPSLQGVTDINEMRKLLKDWLLSFDTEPDEDDVLTVSHYLVELVRDSQVEKVQLLLSYLMFTISSSPGLSEHRKTIHSIHETVDKAMIEKYGCSLHIRY